jgi:hypothetical protein
LQQQRARVDDLNRRNRERAETNEALINDPGTIERYARERDYGRENEVIQQLPDNSEEEPESGSMKK